MRISLERSILVAEQFLQELIKKYRKNPVFTDGGTWYPQACRFLKLRHHIHSYYERSIIERTIQYIKIEQNALMIIFHVKKITVH